MNDKYLLDKLNYIIKEYNNQYQNENNNYEDMILYNLNLLEQIEQIAYDLNLDEITHIIRLVKNRINAQYKEISYIMYEEIEELQYQFY